MIFGGKTETISPWTRYWVPTDYLRKNGRTHGLYLVFWTKTENASSEFKDGRTTKLTAATASAAKAEIDKLVSEYDGTVKPEVVAGCVLDVSI